MCQLLPPFRITATILSIHLLATTAVAEPSWRIFYGEIARPGQFPYQISLLNAEHRQHICGGTIIAPRRVVTAAHCVTLGLVNVPAKHFRVLAGTNIRNDIHNPHAVYTKVERISVYPKWQPMRMLNDYAVVITVDELYTAATSAPIGPLPLQRDGEVPVGSNCVISGWGRTQSEKWPRLLRYATVQVIDQAKCAAIYEMISMPDAMICALGSRDEDSGQGDSGGPMVCDGRLVGIVSFGPAEPSPGVPGVYARVSDNWYFLMCRAAGVAGGWSVVRLLAAVAGLWVISGRSEWGFV